MITEVTNGVKVSVKTEFLPEYSSPIRRHYAFSYTITIENTSEFAVRLLRRFWLVVDSDGEKCEVEGEGVVGQQPIIEPGESYQYISGCNLKTPLGKMLGSYLMERPADSDQFKVKIPEFVMVAPFMLN